VVVLRITAFGEAWLVASGRLDSMHRLAAVVPERWRCGSRLGLVAGLGLLLIRLAFALIVPLGSAPDEGSHFIKAYGSAHFQAGDTTNVPLPQTNDMERLNYSLGAVYDMGDDAIDPSWGCNAFNAEVPANCVNLDWEVHLHNGAVTPFGAFQPYLYVVIGLPTLVIHDPDSALFVMRLVIVLWSSILAGLALMIVGRRFGTAALLAALIGSTPMVLYAQGTLGTSGIETAAAFGAFAAALDVLWDAASSRRSSRVLLVAAIVSLTLCRPLSVLVAAILAVLVVLTFGRRVVFERIRALPRAFTVPLAAITTVCVVANLGWALRSSDVYRGQDVGIMRALGRYVLRTLPELWQMVIGVFEWLDTELPLMAVVSAWAVIGLVMVNVFPRRDRAASVRFWYLIAATLGFGFVIEYTVFARVGGLVQGRHLLPLFQLWPLVAALPNRGEPSEPVLDRVARQRLRIFAAVGGSVVGVAVLYVARREAVGILGPLNFFGHAAYHPPIGWVVPFVVLIAGLCLSYVVPVALGLIERTPDSAAPTFP